MKLSKTASASPSSTPPPVVVVGAGLAGLACARHLQRAGIPVVVHEASDGVGGRVRSDHVDGFILDRGFQVLLSGYPEAKSVLDYAKLDLRYFTPGSMIWMDGAMQRLSDPFRRPLDLLANLKSPVGSFSDKARLGLIRINAQQRSLATIWSTPETTAMKRLQAFGLSDAMFEHFLRPLFTGILLDPTLSGSSRMAEFVFKMLVSDGSAVPARGMQAIPEQLAASLSPGTVHLKSAVSNAAVGKVTLAKGTSMSASAVVVATEGATAAKLLNRPADLQTLGTHGVSCVYFAAPAAPIDEPILVLNGSGSGLVNNLAVMSHVSKAYAPAKSHLLAVQVLGTPEGALDVEVRRELKDWFGGQVDQWRHLRTYRIPDAQPALPSLDPPSRAVRLEPGLYVCGDHREQASIQGALVSGRLAAEAVLADLAEIS